MKSALIYYHEADLDGKLSFAICALGLEKQGFSKIDSIGWDYHKNKNMPRNWESVADRYDKIFIVDLSIPVFLNDKKWYGKVVWIDHHISAIKEYPTNIRGLRIDGVAAGRLCWQYFFNEDYDLLTLSDFTERKVQEPEFVALAGEYDVFAHRDDDYHMALNSALFSKSAKYIQEFLSSVEDDTEPTTNNSAHWSAVEEGLILLEDLKETSKRLPLFRMRKDKCFGKEVFFVNSHSATSLIFEKDERVERADFVGVFRVASPTLVKLSIYKKNKSCLVDSVDIAKLFGGGGHKGAAGFELTHADLFSVLE